MTDHQPPSSHGPELLDRRSVRAGLFVVVPLALCALVASAIHVSLMGIDHTILVLGDRELKPGQPAAVRLCLMTDSGELLPLSRVEGALACDGSERPLSLHQSAADPLPAYSFTPPQDAMGQCRVLLDLEFSGKRQRVSYSVTLSSSPALESLSVPRDVPEDARPSTVWVGPRRIELLTEDRGAPTGLSSVVFLRATTEEFAPSPDEFFWRGPEEGDWNELRPSAVGLVALPLRPFDMSARLTVRGSRRAGEASSEPISDARLEPLVVYSGISVAMHNPLLQDQEPLRLTARQLSSHGPLLVDAFQDGRYVAGFNGQFQGGVADLRLRLPGPGLYRLQLTSSPFSTDKALAVRHVYALSRSESPNDALRFLLGRLSESEIDGQWAERVARISLEQGVGFDRQTLAAFALARLYRGARPLERLLSSRQEDDAELARFKTLFQRGVMFSILLLGVGVAALFCLLAIAASRRQGRITAMILSEPVPGDDQEADLWHTDHGRAEDRWRTPLSAAVLFVVVVGAFAALAVLVFVLRWFG